MRALLVAAAWRLLVALAGIVGHDLLPPGRFQVSSLAPQGWPPGPLSVALDAGIRGDADWYAKIARQGYSYSSHHQSSIAFYPAYPGLIHAVSWVTGNVYVAGMIISTVCLFLAVAALWAWLGVFGMSEKAPAATTMILLFPWSIFFAAMYSESLYLVLAILSFLLAERRRWPACALTVSALVLTRPTGVLILPCLALVAAGSRPVSPGAALPFAGAIGALVGFGAYQAHAFGTPFATERAAAVQPWSRSLQQGVSDIALRAHPGFPTWYLIYMMVVGGLVVATLPQVLKVLPAPYALFVALAVVFPALSGLQSLERYCVIAFPAFVGVACLRNRRLLVALTAFQVWLMLFFAAAFSAGWAVF